MTTILIIVILINLIYGTAIVWCIRTNPVKVKKPSKKMLRQRRETMEILEYKLSTEYVKLKAV